jgi:hypothetical protein
MKKTLLLLALLSLSSCSSTADLYDFDGDGTVDSVDCAPTDPNIHPAASELCSDGIDNDCDAWVDCEDSDCFNLPECPGGDDDDSAGDDDDSASDDDDSAGDDDDSAASSDYTVVYQGSSGQRWAHPAKSGISGQYEVVSDVATEQLCADLCANWSGGWQCLGFMYKSNGSWASDLAGSWMDQACTLLSHLQESPTSITSLSSCQML